MLKLLATIEIRTLSYGSYTTSENVIMLILYAAAFIFFALHLFPSTPLRASAVALGGEGAYMAVFSVLSLASLAWLTETFKAADYGDKLWLASAGWLYVKAALILFAFVLVVGGVTAPNPSLPGAEKVLDREDAASGVFAITRHPFMWGVGIWALCHIVTQATPRGIAFFGSLAATALLGAYLQERRKRVALGVAWRLFEAKTSFVPFMALIEGRAHLSLRAFGWWRIALAVVLWAGLLHAHQWLFGASPLPGLS